MRKREGMGNATVALAVVCLAVGLRGSAPDDWPQWRGPARDGRAVIAPRSSWPEQPVRVWRTEVGIGHAAPVVSGGKVFVSAREGEQEVVRALDLDTGRELWRAAHAVPYRMNPAAMTHGKGPKSTPLVHDGRVFVLGISGTFSAYDAQSGKVLWRKIFADRYQSTSPLYGSAMSPVAEGGVIVAHVGGHDAGALVAFEPATGNERWRWDGDGPGYASPIVIERDGGRQIVTQSQRAIVGINAKTGALLWRVPFNVEYDQNIVTPLAWKDLLIMSGLDQGTFALRLSRRDGAWTAERAWETRDVSMYMSSPVLAENLVVGLTPRNKGQVFGLDPATGRVLWTSAPRQGDNAALIASGSTLLALTTDATLMVARTSTTGLETLRRYDVGDSATWAHPAVLTDGVLVKDERAVTRWRW